MSNDNPYSEAQFKTLKYSPAFPSRFGSIEDARTVCGTFFPLYNTEHRHAGLGLMTPESVHYGYAQQLQEVRRRTLQAAYAAHPERFVRKSPEPPELPKAAWINPPREKTTRQVAPGATIATSDEGGQGDPGNRRTAPLIVTPTMRPSFTPETQ